MSEFGFCPAALQLCPDPCEVGILHSQWTFAAMHFAFCLTGVQPPLLLFGAGSRLWPSVLIQMSLSLAALLLQEDSEGPRVSSRGQWAALGWAPPGGLPPSLSHSGRPGPLLPPASTSPPLCSFPPFPAFPAFPGMVPCPPSACDILSALSSPFGFLFLASMFNFKLPYAKENLKMLRSMSVLQCKPIKILHKASGLDGFS